jgi:hypothetical protein
MMTALRSFSIFGLLSLIGVAALAKADDATKASLTLSMPDATDVATHVEITITASRVTEGGRVGEERQLAKCQAPGVCTIDLAPGVWLLTGSDDPRYYVAPQSVIVIAGHPATATLTIARTTAVTGTVTGTDVAEATMRFQSSDPRNTISGDVVPCSFAQKQWTCRVPRGTWDLRFRIPGHASHYFADVTLADAPKVLGNLQMKRGASLVGHVEVLAPRGVAPAPTSVTLTPSGARGTKSSEPSSYTAVTDAKGFFHVAGITPGEYLVQARRAKMKSEARTVGIIADREASLRDPLVVAAPAELRVIINSVDPRSAAAWTVELLKLLEASGQTESLTERKASGGTTRFVVDAGAYEIRIKDDAGSVWAKKQAHVAIANVDVTIDVGRRQVEGRVRLGEKGIPATLELQDAEVGSRITIEAAEDGTFRADLPLTSESALWRVRIESPLLFLTRTIDDARITTNADGVARLDIDLPATRLSGRVVDADGKPVGRGLVDVASTGSGEGVVQADIAADGEFVLNGLAPGEYSLHATTIDKRSSDIVRGVIREDDEETRVTLTLRADREIKGSVVSDAGPVPGATVLVLSTDRPVETFRPWTTDANGRFAFLLPNGSVECDFLIDAPGFAMRIFHRRFESDSVAIRVDQRGGKARLRLPAWHGDPRKPHPWLIHDGAVLSAHMLLRQPARSVDGTTVIVATLEPGAYQLCLGQTEELAAFRIGQLPLTRCVTGILAPFGEMELDLTALAPPSEGSLVGALRR